ncbi:hypothetical protein Q4R54_16705, partial [Morganella morganii]
VVNWTQNKGNDVALSATTSKTRADGTATITLKSTTTAVDNVTVSGQYESTAAVAADRNVSFTYELTSAVSLYCALTVTLSTAFVVDFRVMVALPSALV